MFGVSTKLTLQTNPRSSLDHRWRISAGLALTINSLTPAAGFGYTAAGDRNFPATLILPQVAPSDAAWGTFSTQPMNAVNIGDPTRESSFVGTYSKTITDQLGIQLEGGLKLLDRLHRSPVNGLQNLDVQIQYQMILDQPHEFVLSAQVDREFGGTGYSPAGADKQSATQPAFTFAKGLGDLPIGAWRPLAITGFAGYQIAEGVGRPNVVNAGFSLQYSIPYLVSKVATIDLPPFLRGTTPMVEVMYSAPAGPSHKQSQTLVVAPGISYSEGRGWELGIEAMIPTNRATGSGLGVIAQVVVQLDYLLPDSVLGQPIFSPH